ncbi:DUF4291 family protein [Streptomyces sp. QTS137]
MGAAAGEFASGDVSDAAVGAGDHGQSPRLVEEGVRCPAVAQRGSGGSPGATGHGNLNLWVRGACGRVRLQPLPHRSLQLGLSGEAARRYADEWTVSITDITGLAHEIHGYVRDGDLEAARRLLPREAPYPAPDDLLDHLRPPAQSPVETSS